MVQAVTMARPPYTDNCAVVSVEDVAGNDAQLTDTFSVNP